MQTKHKQIWRTAFAASSLACVTMLSGCGGASNGTPLLATPVSGPAVNGLDANNALGGTLFEVSGLASPDGLTSYLTGPVASTAKPSAVVANSFSGTIPLGFAPDGSFGLTTSNVGIAVAPGANVIFGASISGGNSTTAPIPINTSSIVLTSTEVPGFSQPLKFNTTFTSQSGANPLVQAQYTTGTFALPFTTTGLHRLVASVGDQSGQSSTTTFDTVVVGPNDAAVYVGFINIPNTKKPGTITTAGLSQGDTIELDDAKTGVKATLVAGARQQATADTNGVVILFIAPGTYTLKSISADGKTVTQQQDAAGKTVTITIDPGTAFVQ